MLTPRRLPSLNGIRAFEAAARSGSFARAAEELAVTPAAISRLVRLLELRLGLPLFLRQANRLTLTPPGAAYAAGLTRILDDTARLTAEILGDGQTQIVTIGVGPSFAIRWLIPRLAALQAQAPAIEVRITTGGAATPFQDGWTCGIRLGTGDWPGLVAVPLVSADLLPVCAPALAARIQHVQDLAPHTLIRVAHAPEDWPLWLGDAAIRPGGPVFEYYGQALQAALDGLGVAMGVRPYIDDDLAAGRLVAPFRRTVSKGKSWYLVYQPVRAKEPGLAAFLNWIREAAGA
ncbi:LysR substrate-binding domain-containing protein [Plastoroseomonas arctica]|uniref:LysR family transcriptional regulator n=1 Tax=Plastoroseomonas arctica TaxID=1509237 RepID=A0AAF1JY79_9PROT|nr:LysR substrate-binding domain-containing protein [Plastoroseomonas arctica]MBR0656734.1 LysR family transcriptional regulator [Plastoroseomonas arctica]